MKEVRIEADAAHDGRIRIYFQVCDKYTHQWVWSQASSIKLAYHDG